MVKKYGTRRENIYLCCIAAFFVIGFFIPAAESAIFGFGKKEFNAYKKETNNKFGQVDNIIQKTQQELGVVKDNTIKLAASLEARIDTKIAGIDNSLRQEIKAGRDAINTTNDTNLMKTIIYVLGSLLLLSILAHGLFVYFVYLLVKKYQHYKTLVKGDYKK